MNHRHDWHAHYLASLSRFESISIWINNVIFTPLSALFHTLWFVAWILLGLDINLLTMIVSLEAIYVTLFIGLGQNLSAKRDKVAQEQRDHMQESIEHLILVNNDLTQDIHAHIIKDSQC